MQRFTLIIFKMYMVYVPKQYILRKDVTQNLPTLKQLVNRRTIS